MRLRQIGLKSLVILCLVFFVVLGFFSSSAPISADDGGNSRRIHADDSLITKSGTWGSQPTQELSSGRYLYSSGTVGDALTLEFEGTSVEIFYVEHPSLGSFGIEIDNVLVRSVIAKGDSARFGLSQAVSYLSEGRHTLRIIAIEGIVAIEAIEVNPLSITDPLLATVQARGTVPVIVELNIAFQAEGELSGMAASSQRQNIQAAQSNVINGLSGQAVTGVQTYEHLPFIAMQVDAAGLQALRNNPLVKSIKQNQIRRADLGYSTPLIHAPTAWNAGYDGTGTVVAVLDTGVDSNHPFLADVVAEEACFSNGTEWENAFSACPNAENVQLGEGSADPTYCNELMEDSFYYDCDHGTHVAGIALGRDPGGANATGYNGVAKGAELIAVQVFTVFTSIDDCGSALETPCPGAWDSDILAGLDFVYDHTSTAGGEYDNIASVNLSLGGGRYYSVAECETDNPDYVTAGANLNSVNVAVIASSGNDGYKNSLGGPGCVSTFYSIGATTTNRPGSTPDTVAGYSNSASFLDFLAPGSRIQSSVPGGYAIYNGTSMAAPHVAGAWAVVRQRFPNYSVAQIADLFSSTAKPVTDSANGLTHPRIDFEKMFTIPITLEPTSGAALYSAAPSFRWTAVPSATWYRIVASSPAGGATIDTWQQVGVGVICEDNVCEYKASTNIGPGTTAAAITVNWTVTAYTTSVQTPSQTATFSVGIVQSPTPTGTLSFLPEFTDNQAGKPTFTWGKTANGNESHYQLYLSKVGTGAVYNLWFAAADACSSNCSVQPDVALGNGNYSFYMRVWGPDGYGPYSGPYNFSLNVSTLPAAITGIEHNAQETGEVSIIWPEDPNASGYRIYLVGPTGSSPSGTISGTVGNEITCVSSVCSRSFNMSKNGSWTVYIAGFNAGGNGPWSAAYPFSLAASGPGVISKISPEASDILSSGLAEFTWTHDENATGYELYVGGPSGFVDFRQWDAESYCASTCSVTLLLPSNGVYKWYLHGYSHVGPGPWSPLNGTADNWGAVEFTVSASLPAIINKELPSNGGTVETIDVELGWEHDANATSYNVYISGPGGFTSNVTYVVGESVTCSSSCAVTIPLSTNGVYTWYLRGHSAAGFGPWAASGYGPSTFTLAATAPSASVTKISPYADEVVSTNPVTFTWDRVNNATWYALVLVNSNTGAVISTTWYSTTTANCVTNSVCTANATVATGSYKWAVLTWGPGSSSVPAYVPGVTPTYDFDKLG